MVCLYCDRPLRKIDHNEYYCDHCKQLYRATILPAAKPPSIDWYDLVIRTIQSDMKRRHVCAPTSSENSEQSAAR